MKNQLFEIIAMKGPTYTNEVLMELFILYGYCLKFYKEHVEGSVQNLRFDEIYPE